mmetsp:Transcript_39010/g.91236  ORF Transcript_39010/g.91236 Transcript_39010/m.91236 type:complete len:238 (-) Transcript_39010:704-1417(-)
MVGSSIMRMVRVGSNCSLSQAHEATSVTNMRGWRITCLCRVRTFWLESPPDVWFIRSMPNRSFSSICAIELDVDEPRSPHSHEHVTCWLCTHAKGMPMLKSVCATSRLTRRARQQKMIFWSGKSSGSEGASDVFPVSGGERRSTRRASFCVTALKSSSCEGYGWRNLAEWRVLNCEDESSCGCLRKHLCTVNLALILRSPSTWRASLRSCISEGKSAPNRILYCVSKMTTASARLRT